MPRSAAKKFEVTFSLMKWIRMAFGLLLKLLVGRSFSFAGVHQMAVPQLLFRSSAIMLREEALLELLSSALVTSCLKEG
jgi:hypothetical protein